MNTQKTLTQTQQRALATYGDLVRTHKVLPSIREFCEARGYKSSSTGHAVLGHLREAGFPCYTRNCGHLSKGQQGREEMTRAMEYWLNRAQDEDADFAMRNLVSEIAYLKPRAELADWLQSENQSLTNEVVKLRAKLAAVQRWVIYADRHHGVEKTEPHDWKTPVGRRVDLLIALGEITS